MNGTKATGKTIGEVEKLTGIPKRDLKYYIEQDIMRPSQRAENGYWLYDETDIRRARLTALCRELGFPVKAIRGILADPDSRWPEELSRHISRLTDRKNRTKAQLYTAKLLQNRKVWEALQLWCDSLSEQ